MTLQTMDTGEDEENAVYTDARNVGQYSETFTFLLISSFISLLSPHPLPLNPLFSCLS